MSDPLFNVKYLIEDHPFSKSSHTDFLSSSVNSSIVVIINCLNGGSGASFTSSNICLSDADEGLILKVSPNWNESSKES